jgi:hypothetical protein
MKTIRDLKDCIEKCGVTDDTPITIQAERDEFIELPVFEFAVSFPSKALTIVPQYWDDDE